MVIGWEGGSDKMTRVGRVESCSSRERIFSHCEPRELRSDKMAKIMEDVGFEVAVGGLDASSDLRLIIHC